MTQPQPKARHYVEFAFARLLIGTSKVLPYRWRVPTIGWLTRQIVAPLAGWNRRVRDNLAYVWPSAEPDLVDHIVRGACDNAGRSIIETWSSEAFIKSNQTTTVSGPGFEALTAARDAGKPIVLVTGHFGNYDAIGATLEMQGFKLGVLYKPMSNPLFNKAYVKELGTLCDEVFDTGRRGVTRFVKRLRDGGTVAMLLDVHRGGGVPIDFLGKPAMTSTSAAEWAIKYNAFLVPVYAIRQDDGIGFEIYVDAPIQHTDDPIGMTQDLCDSLARLIEKKPEQWFWIHRRWKPMITDQDQSTLTAATIRPGPGS